MLSLLVLFTLIGVTFVLVASQSRRATRADARHEQYGDDPQKQLDSIFAQLVRDTTNPQSSLQGHSLLADIYGNDGARGVVTSAMQTFGTNGQFFDLTASAAMLTNLPGALYPTATQIQTPGFYNGCVLTMLDGPAANLSARIVGWSYAAGNFTISIMAFDWPNAQAAIDFVTATNNTFVINGRPFNGTGFGFDPNANPTVDPTLLRAVHPYPLGGMLPTNIAQALLPNPRFFVPNAPYLAFGGIGGADEDYDAPDPQNMLLAYMPISVPATLPSPILPSLHRPDLLNYYLQQYRTNSGNAVAPLSAISPDLIRRAMLRPLVADHPNFTGSNPTFDAINGPWDVDNDGDGIADSVWVDIGLPVQTAPDGRRFKPLAAVLCLDMDGRLNVNAHGNIAQAHTDYDTQINPGGAGSPTIADYLFSPNATALANVVLPRGSGYGPPEINLLPIFTPATAAADYSSFFRGRVQGSRTYEGRYGEYGLASPYTVPLPGGTAALRADNILGSIKHFDFPNNYYGGTLAGYGSPSDLWGRAVMGIDYAGQPIYSFLQQTPGAGGFAAISSTGNLPDADLPNDPYTLNLSKARSRGAGVSPTPNDAAFTPAELERILRRFDLDSIVLPDRLRVLLDPAGTNPNDLGRMITTDSYDLPSPGTLPTRDFATALRSQSGGFIPAGSQVVDLLRAKVIRTLVDAGTIILPMTPPQQTIVDTVMAPMLNSPIYHVLPPEILAGQRFDLNRPFGNGEDDNGNGVVDEPTPSEFNTSSEVPTTWTSAFGAAAPPGLDLNNDGVIDPNPASASSDLYARQQYAKYLYVLMMLFADQDYLWGQDNGTPLTIAEQTMQREIMARRIAQWAINVVDFRDPDSIMTPFEYDVNPFNGWSVTGILEPTADPDVGNTERRLVWGCEQPDLLLTETMALHDRRVRDSDNDDGVNNDRANTKMTGADPTLDQSGVPQGSVFFELFCPRNANASQHIYSADIYNAGQLNLAKLAPAGGPTGLPYPVWRIAITQSRAVSIANPPNDINARVQTHPDTTNFDPVEPLPATAPSGLASVFDPLNNAPGRATIERIVWFTSQDPTGYPEAPFTYYNRAAMPTLLNPGQYALIGPRPDTYIGKSTANISTNAVQQIQLAPTAAVFNSAGQNVYTTNSINPPLPIICSSAALPVGWNNTMTPPNHYIGVSVSEPLFSSPGYYPFPTAPFPLLTYATPADKPFDSDPARATPLFNDKTNGLTTILETGTTPNYKTALLQRLANPLLAYDPVLNPYITVDWQPIDLTVFNGEKRNGATPSPFDPDDPTWTDTLLNPFPAGLHTLVNRQRGTGNPLDADLWNSYPQLPQFPVGVRVPRASGTDVFDYNLPHSLGYLNPAIGTPWTTPPAVQAFYKGAPNPGTGNTFPWLAWNNRPYTSAMELLQVPATSAEQLLRQFSSLPTTGPHPYEAITPTNFHVPCKHLLNFFLSSNGTGDVAPYFYRLLEYVHVPSRFVGTETVLNPSTAPAGLKAPFNKVSNYRDPGRVNINTIPSQPGVLGANPIWNAILNNGGGLIWPGWPAIVASRRNRPPGGDVTASTPYPTVFANPFRTAGGAAFALPGTPPGEFLPAPPFPPFTVPPEVNVTMMRPAPTTQHVPLFQFQAFLAAPYTNPDRNSYFRYQLFERVSNLLTTRSNVYAVWITVGYFEVSPITVDPTRYPDGYRLEQELGSDSGEIKRHRAFYLYDRSIPVGFEPGRDHNFDKGVLIRRFIE